MHLCYVDESGNDQVLGSVEAPPVLVIAGITVSRSQVDSLVWSFLKLKRDFNPQAAWGRQLTDTIKYEVKGSDLRADLRSSSRRRRRRAAGFLDAVATTIEDHGVTVDGEIWVKANGTGTPQTFYPSAIAGIALNFQAQLAAADTDGLMILDARTKVKNVPSVHGITTRRFKSGSNQLPRLVESPVFGHSDAHVALQIADLVASALLFPMACDAFCGDLVGNVHTGNTAYAALRTTFGERLRRLENRYTSADGRRMGGVAVRNRRNAVPSVDLYGAAREIVQTPGPGRQRQRTRGGVGLPPRA
ncbi:MAG: DUF3800 domain-containing protein [Nocardioidaceae bacterium]